MEPENTAKPEKVEFFVREELWRIEQKARKNAQIVANPNWKRAYEDLAHAANMVDACMGRATIKE